MTAPVSNGWWSVTEPTWDRVRLSPLSSLGHSAAGESSQLCTDVI